MGPQLPQNFVGFRQVFTVCVFALKEIGNGIQAQTIYTHTKPKVDNPEYGLPHFGVIVV